MRSGGEWQLGQGQAFDLCSKWRKETLVDLPQSRTPLLLSQYPTAADHRCGLGALIGWLTVARLSTRTSTTPRRRSCIFHHPGLFTKQALKEFW